LLVIRFSAGKNLLDILEQVPTAAQDSAFATFLSSQDLGNAHSGSQLNLSIPNLDVQVEAPVLPIYKTADGTK
jgi:hypothetical protein